MKLRLIGVFLLLLGCGVSSIDAPHQDAGVDKLDEPEAGGRDASEELTWTEPVDARKDYDISCGLDLACDFQTFPVLECARPDKCGRRCFMCGNRDSGKSRDFCVYILDEQIACVAHCIDCKG